MSELKFVMKDFAFCYGRVMLLLVLIGKFIGF